MTLAPKLIDTLPMGTLAQLFWEQVDRGADDICWPWKGPTNGEGYGQFRIFRRQFYAHRQAFVEVNGAIEAGLVVRHDCDNPICCNPAHLLAGTMRDNSQDAVSRGHMHGRRCVRGSRHPSSKLTDEAVTRMRAKYDASRRGDPVLAAREFGISRTNADRILRGQSWTHL